jgi:Bacterial Ig-like domain (group 3)/Putative Ig domain
MTPRKNRYSHYAIQIAATVLISVCWLQPVSTGQTTEVAGGAEAAARENWRASIAHNTPAAAGCFRASYPNLEWEQVECRTVHPPDHPVHRSATIGQTVGNVQDYVAQAAGLISETVGTFPAVTGVTSEKSVGVAAFGGGGILGPNEYSLQINTNATSTTSACAGHTGCTVWQQFVYGTDYSTAGQATLFMQYWLLGWGSSACPAGFTQYQSDCYTNSSGVTAPDMTITTLGSLTLSAAAVAAGNDTAVFNNGTTAYSVSAPDSMLDISQVWNQSEFNIFGDAGGSEADFNTGSSVTVKLALTDGSNAAPTCVANAGSTGETNNLTLGTCSTAGGSSPSIQFDEGNQAPTITSANHATFQVGIPGSFQVTGVGDPTDIIFGESGPLPNGVGFSSSGLLSGKPAAGTAGVYSFTITASNGVGPNATQAFILTVVQAPVITSANHATFTIGKLGSFHVTATGFPAPTFTEIGPLPGVVTLSPSGLLSGIPAPGTSGVYHFTIIASNGALPNAAQSFTLTVNKGTTTCSLLPSSTQFSNGEPIIFTAFVTTGAGNVDTPTGTVTFTDSALYDIDIATVPLIEGVADIYYVLQTPPDRQFIQAVYSGDNSFKACKSPYQTMNYMP